MNLRQFSCHVCDLAPPPSSSSICLRLRLCLHGIRQMTAPLLILFNLPFRPSRKTKNRINIKLEL